MLPVFVCMPFIQYFCEVIKAIAFNEYIKDIQKILQFNCIYVRDILSN